MNPTDPAAGSPLATLRQLKELLDTGAITPQEFETLKQRLLFGPASDAAPADAAVPLAPAAPPAAAPFTTAPSPYLDSLAALTPEATPLLTPEPDWLAAPAPALPAPVAYAPEGVDNEDFVPEERRNPLNLLFAIGGLLLFLGVVAYLTLGRPTTPDEHLTSTTQTAADTLAAAPEVGPQAEQLTLPPAAAPETIRVAPATPPPPTAALPAVADSAASAPVVPVAPVVPAKSTAVPAKSTAPAKAAAPAPAVADTTQASPR